MNVRPRLLAWLAASVGLAGLMLAAQPAFARPSAAGAGLPLNSSRPATSGAQLWASIDGPGDAAAMAVSPDGSSVFVAGVSIYQPTGTDYATVAYAAATGRQVWAVRYNGEGNLNDTAIDIAAGPGGRTVYVTGTSLVGRSLPNWATVSYDAATGAQRWVSLYGGTGGAEARSVKVSPDGSHVFVTGIEFGVYSATVAYQN
jgi:hypothetical protein